jgi:hypothetical protein
MGIRGHFAVRRVRSTSHYWKAVPLVGLFSVILALGGCNANFFDPPITKVVVIPTNTLAPLVTQTQRFTATPIPTDTPIPSVTPLPPSDTPEASAPLPPPPDPGATAVVNAPTPTPMIKGVVKPDANTINLRAGPGTNFRSIGSLRPGNALFIVANSSDGKWSLIRLEDGTEGWVNSTFLTLTNPAATVPVLNTPELTQRAQQATAVVLTQTAFAPTAEGTIVVDAAAPTRSPRINTATDVLAYCEQRPASDAPRNKKFAANARIFVFWSWIAKTPEQMKDHLNNAVYRVKINGQEIGDWYKYATPVTRIGSDYIVYWFVPINGATPGTYKVEFNVTWKTAINDGVENFGPGTEKPSESGTCTFTVNPR